LATLRCSAVKPVKLTATTEETWAVTVMYCLSYCTINRSRSAHLFKVCFSGSLPELLKMWLGVGGAFGSVRVVCCNWWFCWRWGALCLVFFLFITGVFCFVRVGIGVPVVLGTPTLRGGCDDPCLVVSCGVHGPLMFLLCLRRPDWGHLTP